MPDPKLCSHHEFAAKVAVNRLEDIAGFSADITITCKDCGTPFTFIGVEGGLSFAKPMVSPLGVELRCPIRPLTALVDDELNARVKGEADE